MVIPLVPDPPPYLKTESGGLLDFISFEVPMYWNAGGVKKLLDSRWLNSARRIEISQLATICGKTRLVTDFDTSLDWEDRRMASGGGHYGHINSASGTHLPRRWRKEPHQFRRCHGKLSRDQRFGATLYSMNTLLVQKGIYSPEEFELQFRQFAQKNLS
jgi:hypothetical protein